MSAVSTPGGGIEQRRKLAVSRQPALGGPRRLAGRGSPEKDEAARRRASDSESSDSATTHAVNPTRPPLPHRWTVEQGRTASSGVERPPGRTRRTEEDNVSISRDSETETAVHAEAARLWWLQVVLGVSALALGIAVFAWPDETIKVVGFLFGINLIVYGVLRAVQGFVVEGYAVLHRLLVIVFGVLVAIVGIVCVRNVFASAVLLIVFVGIGWLLQGLTEILLGVAGKEDPLRGWRIAAGVAYVVAAIVILVWPAPTLNTFVWVGGVALVVFGIAHIVEGIGDVRMARSVLPPPMVRAPH
jgi:uncharacterized membrane protein HdeD (DUF308 family)